MTWCGERDMINVCLKRVCFQNYINIRHTQNADDPDSGWVGIFNRKTVDRHKAFNGPHLVLDGERLHVFCPGQSVVILRYGRS